MKKLLVGTSYGKNIGVFVVIALDATGDGPIRATEKIEGSLEHDVALDDLTF
jgi:hypothetical protein